jgi:hypothetical protein
VNLITLVSLVSAIAIAIGLAVSVRRERGLVSLRSASSEMIRGLWHAPCSSLAVLQRRMGRSVLASVQVGVGGLPLVPTRCRFELSGEDWDLAEPVVPWLIADLEAWVGERLVKRGVEAPAPVIEIAYEASAVAGSPRVRPSFAGLVAADPPPVEVSGAATPRWSPDLGRLGGTDHTISFASTGAKAKGSAPAAGWDAVGVDTEEMRPGPLVLVGPQGEQVLRPDRQRTWAVGRDATSDLCIDHRRVSKRHARVYWSAGRWFLQDLESSNGTFVDGQRVKGRTELSGVTSVDLAGSVSLRIGAVA